MRNVTFSLASVYQILPSQSVVTIVNWKRDIWPGSGVSPPYSKHRPDFCGVPPPVVPVPPGVCRFSPPFQLFPRTHPRPVGHKRRSVLVFCDGIRYRRRAGQGDTASEALCIFVSIPAWKRFRQNRKASCPVEFPPIFLSSRLSENGRYGDQHISDEVKQTMGNYADVEILFLPNKIGQGKYGDYPGQNHVG